MYKDKPSPECTEVEEPRKRIQTLSYKKKCNSFAQLLIYETPSVKFNFLFWNGLRIGEFFLYSLEDFKLHHDLGHRIR